MALAGFRKQSRLGTCAQFQVTRPWVGAGRVTGTGSRVRQDCSQIRCVRVCVRVHVCACMRVRVCVHVSVCISYAILGTFLTFPRIPFSYL